MNPGSYTGPAIRQPARRLYKSCEIKVLKLKLMPAARGEESERARERCTCIYNKVKSYWGPTNE